MRVVVTRRLTVPAPRTDARETLVTARPFYVRAAGEPPAALPVTQVSPPLLSFDGATFMDDFLGDVATGTPASLPSLLAWRDWAEPPSAMLDVGGAPLYPNSITRATPIRIDPEDEAPGTLDADGVPHASPAWLRKLYLPLHLRFTFVAFDVVCMRTGWPMLDRARVIEAGAVVRRLVRDSAAERWEDWLSADGKTGLWFELHDGLPADPDVIPAGAYRDRANTPADAEIAARLGVTTPLSLKLDSTRLALVPPTVGEGADHCSIYGLLPVFSAATQATDDAPHQTDAAMAQALHDHAQATLSAAWADDAALRARLGPALGTLLDRTILPSATGNPAAAIAAIRAAAIAIQPGLVLSDAQITSSLPTMAAAAMKECRTALAPASTDADAQSSPDAFWVSSGANRAAAGVDTGQVALNGTRVSRAGDWNILVVNYVRRTAASMLTGTGVAGPAGDAALANALLALSLIRLRRYRLGLLATLHSQMFGGDDRATLTAVASQVIAQTTYNLPTSTSAGLSPEIEAALGLDGVRKPAEDAPPWPPFDLSSAATQSALLAHRAGLAVEDILSPVDAAGADAGSAYEARLDSMIASVAQSLVHYFGLPTSGDALYRLKEAAVDLQEQAARGLLVFPGPMPQHSTFTSMTDSVANLYTSNVQTIAKAEASGRARVTRLRYDHASLYAIWCWVRVAGRDACENTRVIWTNRSEPFAIAEPSDVLGAKPATVQLPDLPRLIRDIPRIAKARAKPFVAFNTPPDSGFNVGDDPKKTSRAWGIGFICSFGIPVLTICAYIMFSIIFSILILIPGFAWMLLLKFCIPIPVPKKS